MSSQLWSVVYRTLRRVNRAIPREGRRPTYPDTLIVGMYLWSAWHDRPMCWASERGNYTSIFRPRQLPSRSQFCRRIKTERCRKLLWGVHEHLAKTEGGERLRVTLMDGRGFSVRRHSTDPDATVGYASGGFARGYRLHALAQENGRFTAIRVTPMNVGERHVARELIDTHRPVGFLLADQGYDSGPLYDYARERHVILMVNLPLRTDIEGEMVIRGLTKVTFLPETVVITIQDPAGEQGVMTAGDDCELGVKIPSMEITCVGGCSEVSDTCTYALRIVESDLRSLSQTKRNSLENLLGDSVPNGGALCVVPVEVRLICDCKDLDP